MRPDRSSGERSASSELEEASAEGEIEDGRLNERATDNEATQSYRTTALIIACALFMQNLDATVLATALPTMAREFAVKPAGVSSALTSYLLALAIFIPASGTIADRYGARRIFQAAIILFVAGSIASGLSRGLTSLVVARFVQGIGGAMMMPVGRLLLLNSVARRDLVSAMSWLTMPAMIGPIFGPPVGGLIVTYLDWRWIFWINVPIGVVAILLVRRFIGDIRAADYAPLDRRGFILSGAGLGATIFGLQLVSGPAHAQIALSLLLAGLLAIILYIVHARRTERPILDLSLLAIPTFRLSVIGGTFLRITQGAQPFLIPMLLQLAFGLSAAVSGIVTVAMGLGAFAMKGIARPLLARFGFRQSLVVVGIMVPLAYSITGLFRPSWPLVVIFSTLMACGFLVSLQFTAYNVIAYDEVTKPRLSAASSFYSTFQQLSLSLGVCAAAGALSLSMTLRSHVQPQFADFSTAIFTVAAIAMCALPFNLRFNPEAGAEFHNK